MNVFLSGVPRVGKSTIIQKYLAVHPEIQVRGFRTILGNENDLQIYIVPAGDPNAQQTAKNLVGIRGNGKKPRVFPTVFNSVGTALLRNSGCDLIVMDELGFMESEALTFQYKVLETLNENVPVLGVIKPLRTPFLDAVYAHPKTVVLSVDEANRNSRLADVIKNLF